jgi:FGGY-family pentulose kinase
MPSASDALYVGIDVGTGSARAGIFDARGKRLGMGVCPIQIYRPQEDFVEQSSDDIWQACGRAVRQALADANLGADGVTRIAGIGFDATCSLVALGAGERPVTVSPSGRDEQNIIVWMDHRAIEEASAINATPHDVLKYVGGTISPEMETPKMLWLKKHLPKSWARVARLFDLPDFLSYRATGVDTRRSARRVQDIPRSRGNERAMGRRILRQVGLADLAEAGFAKIGKLVRPMGEKIGRLTPGAAAEPGSHPARPWGCRSSMHMPGVSVFSAFRWVASRPPRRRSKNASPSSGGPRRATWRSRSSRSSYRACGVRTGPRWCLECG